MKRLGITAISYVIYYGFSSYPIILMRILFNYTFDIVSTTNCNTKIYDLFVNLFNHFTIYTLTTLMFIFYQSLYLMAFYTCIISYLLVFLSFLLIIICNTIDIFYQIKKVKGIIFYRSHNIHFCAITTEQ